jgi:hypothetical protein
MQHANAQLNTIKPAVPTRPQEVTRTGAKARGGQSVSQWKPKPCRTRRRERGNPRALWGRRLCEEPAGDEGATTTNSRPLLIIHKEKGDSVASATAAFAPRRRMPAAETRSCAVKLSSSALNKNGGASASLCVVRFTSLPSSAGGSSGARGAGSPRRSRSGTGPGRTSPPWSSSRRCAPRSGRRR